MRLRARPEHPARRVDLPRIIAYGVGWRAVGRPGGESAKSGVDAFDRASHPPEANSQSKRKSLPEGRRRRSPLSPSIKPATLLFDQLKI